jgi:hypothetical protein
MLNVRKHDDSDGAPYEAYLQLAGRACVSDASCAVSHCSNVQ